MCGISGFIGESKNRLLTFRLITYLFGESESRGVDAAGFWGTESGNGSILYHKEPGPSSDLIKKPAWKDLQDVDLNLLLVHARGASSGMGLPAENKNNHPFITSCKSIGLVHNGKIVEYDTLTKKYECFSKCDSEVLLRIFEAGKESGNVSNIIEGESNEIDPVLAKRLVGLRDIWSLVDKGYMAVAIGERVNAIDRSLFLFRNYHRTLWIADLRKELGQVFFCSTPEIWSNAFKLSGVNRIIRNRVKLVELPTQELWILNIANNDEEIRTRKFDICSTGRTIWKPDGPAIPMQKNVPVAQVITKLNDNEEVVIPTAAPVPAVIPPQTKLTQPRFPRDKNERWYKGPINGEGGVFNLIQGGDDDTELEYKDLNLGIEDLNLTCSNIKKLVDQVYEVAEKQLMNEQMNKIDLKELLRDLESLELEVEATIRMMNR